MARRHREIVETLLRRITAGTHPPGSLLPKEEVVAAEFQVSRGTAREALRALEERRVAVVKHGRGATVLDPADWDVVDPVVASVLLNGRGRARLLGEIVESLRVMEPSLVEFAAERATPAECQMIAQVADTYPDEEDPVPDVEQQLLVLVGEASRNRPLAAMVADARRLVALAGEPTDAGLPRAVAWTVVTHAPDAARRLAFENVNALAERLTRRRR